MMKREMNSSSAALLLDRLSVEHELFYYKMLSRPPKEIYESCSIIRFYDTVWEYFQYKEELEQEHIDACLKENGILQALYDIYLQKEHLRIDTWEDIEELLDNEADRWKQGK